MSNYKGPYNSLSQNAEPIYNQSNILGTVSQSGGAPTGAIIERGSNANGEFVKYADGTMICHIQKNLGSVVSFGSGTPTDPYRTSAINVTFPAFFTVTNDERPRASLHPQIFSSNVAEQNVKATSSRPANNGENLGIVRVVRDNNNTAANDAWLSVTVIGRWY